MNLSKHELIDDSLVTPKGRTALQPLQQMVNQRIISSKIPEGKIDETPPKISEAYANRLTDKARTIISCLTPKGRLTSSDFQTLNSFITECKENKFSFPYLEEIARIIRIGVWIKSFADILMKKPGCMPSETVWTNTFVTFESAGDFENFLEIAHMKIKDVGSTTPLNTLLHLLTLVGKTHVINIDVDVRVANLFNIASNLSQKLVADLLNNRSNNSLSLMYLKDLEISLETLPKNLPVVQELETLANNAKVWLKKAVAALKLCKDRDFDSMAEQMITGQNEEFRELSRSLDHLITDCQAQSLLRVGEVVERSKLFKHYISKSQWYLSVDEIFRKMAGGFKFANVDEVTPLFNTAVQLQIPKHLLSYQRIEELAEGTRKLIERFEVLMNKLSEGPTLPIDPATDTRVQASVVQKLIQDLKKHTSKMNVDSMISVLESQNQSSMNALQTFKSFVDNNQFFLQNPQKLSPNEMSQLKQNFRDYKTLLAHLPFNLDLETFVMYDLDKPYTQLSKLVAGDAKTPIEIENEGRTEGKLEFVDEEIKTSVKGLATLVSQQPSIESVEKKPKEDRHHKEKRSNSSKSKKEISPHHQDKIKLSSGGKSRRHHEDSGRKSKSNHIKLPSLSEDKVKEMIKGFQDLERALKQESNKETRQTMTLKPLEDFQAVQKFLELNKKANIGEPTRAYFEELNWRYNKFLETLEQTLNRSTKPRFADLEPILDLSCQFPIELSAVQTPLMDILQRGAKFEHRINNLRSLNLETFQDIKEEFRKCPVYIPEAERIIEAFNEAQELVETIEKQANENPKTIQYEDLNQMNASLAKIPFELGNQQLSLKAKIFVMRAEKVKNSFNPKKKSQKEHLVLSFPQLKFLLWDGYYIHKNLSPETPEATKVKEAVTILESIALEVEEFLEQIYKFKDPKIIAGVQTTYRESIDVSEDILAYKQIIATNPDHEPKIVSVVCKEDKNKDEVTKRQSTRFSMKAIDSFRSFIALRKGKPENSMEIEEQPKIIKTVQTSDSNNQVGNRDRTLVVGTLKSVIEKFPGYETQEKSSVEAKNVEEKLLFSTWSSSKDEYLRQHALLTAFVNSKKNSPTFKRNISQFGVTKAIINTREGRSLLSGDQVSKKMKLSEDGHELRIPVTQHENHIDARSPPRSKRANLDRMTASVKKMKKALAAPQIVKSYILFEGSFISSNVKYGTIRLTSWDNIEDLAIVPLISNVNRIDIARRIDGKTFRQTFLNIKGEHKQVKGYVEPFEMPQSSEKDFHSLFESLKVDDAALVYPITRNATMYFLNNKAQQRPENQDPKHNYVFVLTFSDYVDGTDYPKNLLKKKDEGAPPPLNQTDFSQTFNAGNQGTTQGRFYQYPQQYKPHYQAPLQNQAQPVHNLHQQPSQQQQIRRHPMEEEKPLGFSGFSSQPPQYMNQQRSNFNPPQQQASTYSSIQLQPQQKPQMPSQQPNHSFNGHPTSSMYSNINNPLPSRGFPNIPAPQQHTPQPQPQQPRLNPPAQGYVNPYPTTFGQPVNPYQQQNVQRPPTSSYMDANPFQQPQAYQNPYMAPTNPWQSWNSQINQSQVPVNYMMGQGWNQTPPPPQPSQPAPTTQDGEPAKKKKKKKKKKSGAAAVEPVPEAPQPQPFVPMIGLSNSEIALRRFNNTRAPPR